MQAESACDMRASTIFFFDVSLLSLLVRAGAASVSDVAEPAAPRQVPVQG